MSEIQVILPVGRLVRGSLYRAQIKKNEDNTDSEKTSFWFAVAIEKKGETHWNQTEWGSKIWEVGQSGYPDGRALSPTFSWKITDGDSAIPDTKGNKPCDREGHIGNWVLSFSSVVAPSVCDSDAKNWIVQPDFVNCGDFIRVVCGVLDNRKNGVAAKSPGVYLNHKAVAFIAYGSRIQSIEKIELESLRGQLTASVLPAGASLTPVASGSFAPPVTEYTAPAAVQSTPAAAPPAYPQILSGGIPAAPIAPPVAPVAPIKKMAPGLEGTYDAHIAMGWTDEMLLRDGKMLP